MKRRSLPFAYFILTFAFSSLLISATLTGDDKNVEKRSVPTDYFSMVRNNQVTGEISPADYLRAVGQISQHQSTRNGNENEYNWNLMGPNNIGGRTRALLFDNRDAEGNTMYAGSVTGGLFRTDNMGAQWYKIAMDAGNMNVTCIAQTGDGTIYVGTGESFFMKDSTAFSNWGYTSGLMGQGIFKSTDGMNFSLLSSTKPTLNGDEELDWGYVNELAVSSSGSSIYASTNTGLKYSSDGGNNWQLAKVGDSTELALSSKDVKMAENGMVIAEVDNLCYISTDGNPNHFALSSGDSTYNLPVINVGRMEFAISPTNNDIVYALVVDNGGALKNVYRSDDGGATWMVVGPGGSQYFNVFNTTSTYVSGNGLLAATIEVFPDDPYHVLVGGAGLWEGVKVQEGGYYQWTLRSQSATVWLSPTFLWQGQHVYKFVPGSTDTFYVGSDGGITKALIHPEIYEYQFMNKDYISSQFYTVSYSGEKKLIVGGAQNVGTIKINGVTNPSDSKRGNDIWTNAADVPNGKNGGYCAYSTIYPDAVIYSRFPHPAKNDALETFVRRNEYGGGPDWSSTMFSGNYSSQTTAFTTPFLLYEDYEDYNTKDSVSTVITKDYPAGSTIWVESKNGRRPFKYVTPVALSAGDSVMVPDYLTARFFIGGLNRVALTTEVIQFNKQPEWFIISDKDHGGVENLPQCMAYSHDANHLFVGTDKGNLYRISNIKYAYDYNTADVNSPYCVISSMRIPIYLPGTTTEITQVITSVAVDPNNDNRVIITLGNYGNDDYVYFCDNALDENPVFRSVQGDPNNGGLPQIPAFSSLIEMDPSSDLIFVGTEYGIYVTENISSANPTWVAQNNNIGGVPVFMLKQQTIRKGNDTITFINIDTTYVVHYGVNNYGVIYGATYGRGLISLDEFQKPVGIDEPAKINAKSGFSIYPNPAHDKVTVAFEISSDEHVEISIFNLSGTMVKHVDLGTRPEGRQDAILNCRNLASGAYVVRLTLGNSQTSSKLIIQ